ncbi:anthrax toxin receptor-like [Sigmodon hispidus]
MRQNWRQSRSGQNCQGVFDLYFILDKSNNVGENWINIYSFTENLVKKFQNPKLRISFIIYSTDANILMPLTSDREAIRNGLLRLQNVIPEGHSSMEKGFIKANEQIRKATLGGNNVNSVIVALTNGVLTVQSFKETLEEANKARKMGAIVYTVGVHQYNKWQMIDIADSPNHSFGVNSGFTALKDIIEPLASKSCTEVISVQPSYVCIKDSYQVNISGHGFGTTKDMSQVICRFTFSDSRVVDESPIDKNENSITCPGPKILHPKEEVYLEVSLNNGISFIGNKLIITGTNCENTMVWGCERQAGEPPEGSTKFSWSWLLFLPVLLVVLLLPCCCWKLCCRKPKELPPPPPQPEKELPRASLSLQARLLPARVASGEPRAQMWAGVVQEPEEEDLPPPSTPSPVPPLPQASSPANPNPTVIVACCGCGNRGVQGTMNTCCSYLQPSCHQMPVMWCHPKVQFHSHSKGRCSNFTVMNPNCTQISCSPRMCLRSNRDCYHLAQPPCTSRIVLQPNGECFNISQAPCSPNICVRTNPECVPVAQTVCSKMCSPNPKCYALNCSQPPCPTKCTKSSSRMLPLLPPHTRQSVESLCHTHPGRPSSTGPKF